MRSMMQALGLGMTAIRATIGKSSWNRALEEVLPTESAAKRELGWMHEPQNAPGSSPQKAIIKCHRDLAAVMLSIA